MARTPEQVDLAMRVTLWVIAKHWNLGELGAIGVIRDLPWMYQEIAEMMFGPDASGTHTAPTRSANGADS